MFDRLEFMVSEAFVAMRRNWLMSLAAISTVSVALFLLGGLGYVYWRVSGFAEQMPGKFDMKVFVLDGTLQADVRKLAIDLRAIKGVKTVVLIPKEREWAKQQQKMPDVTQGVENPLPDSFKVTLEEISNATRVSDQIKRLNNLDPSNPVVYDTSAQQLLSDSLYLVRWLGGVLGTLLFCTAGVQRRNQSII